MVKTIIGIIVAAAVGAGLLAFVLVKSIGGSEIIYSDKGFSPAEVSLNSGGVLTVKNTSSHEVDVESGPHPEHTQNKELNLGEIKSGQSRAVKVSRHGSFGIHNHLNEKQSADIIVH